MFPRKREITDAVGYVGMLGAELLLADGKRAAITALGRDGFSAAAWPLVGRKVSKARLINDIYATATSSIALPVPLDSAAITMFRMVIADARSLIQTHRRQDLRYLHQTAYVSLALI